jgi:hypothetical protein
MLAAAGGSLVAISLRFQVEIYVASSKSSGSFSFFYSPQSPSTKFHRGLCLILTSINFRMGRNMAQQRGLWLKVVNAVINLECAGKSRDTAQNHSNANDPTHRLVHRIFSEYIGRVSLPARSGRRRCIGDLDLNVRPEALAVCALTLVGKCPHCRRGRHTAKLALPGECWPRGNAPQRQATTYRRSRNAC